MIVALLLQKQGNIGAIVNDETKANSCNYLINAFDPL
jgi:hypothetical protein